MKIDMKQILQRFHPIGSLICLFLVVVVNALMVQGINERRCEIESGVAYREAESYVFPDSLVCEDDTLAQYFIPANPGLCEIQIRLAYNHQIYYEEYGAGCMLTLEDASGQVLYEEEITEKTVDNWQYYTLKVEDLKKGSRYCLTLRQTYGARDENGNFRLSWVPFIYTAQTSDIPKENRGSRYNDEPQDYEWDLIYSYSYPDYSQIGWVVLADFLLLTLVVIFACLCKKGNQKITMIFGILTPLAQFLLAEAVLGHLGTLTSGAWFTNLLTLYVIFALLSVFCIRQKIPIYIMTTCCPIMALGAYYVYSFRGSPFTLQDFRSASTAAKVMGTYNFALTIPQGILLLLVIMLLWLTCFLPSVKATDKKQIIIRKLGSSAVTALLVLGFLIGFPIDLRDRTIIDMWNVELTYSTQGYFWALVNELQYLRNTKPEGYSPEMISELVQEYAGWGESVTENVIQEKTTPANLIIIMNESWADYRYLGDFEGADEIMPYIDSLQENVVKGFVHAPVYGAGTPNTEWEVLTGNSMGMLNGNDVPYQLYISEKTYGLADIMNRMGYYSVAMHPHFGDNWNRENVYRLMEFDDFISVEDWSEDNRDIIRWYISDSAAYKELERVYEECDADKFFSFLVTMQNHGSYEEVEGFESRVDLNTAEDYPQAEQYLTLIQETDKAFEELLDYYSKVEEPTMIVMFGDHQPNIEDGFYEELLGVAWDDMDDITRQSIFVTPYIIWTNYDLEASPKGPEMSTNYLGSYVLALAELDLTEYEKSILGMEQEMPILGVGAVRDNEGNWYSYREPSEELGELMKDYSILQYNNMFDKRGRKEEVFTLDGAQAEFAGQESSE